MSSGPEWLIGFLRSHGVKLERAWFAIIMRESGGNPSCIYPAGSPHNGWATSSAPYWDTGLCQINNRHLADMRTFFKMPAADMRLMLDADRNFAYAQHLTNGGTYFGDWGLHLSADGSSYSFDWAGWPSDWVAANAKDSEQGFMYWWNKYPTYAKAAGTVPPAPVPTPKPVPVPSLPSVSVASVQPGKSNGQVLVVQKALAAEVGLDYSSGPGVFGPRTKAAYAAWQRKLGYTGSEADGAPGIKSLTTLGSRRGFKVVP